MRKLVVLIDPGHGGADPGAVAAGMREADINLAVARRLVTILADHGVQVHTTRWQDTTVSLGERCAQEHRLRPDLFLSLHCNAAVSPEARGIEIWTSPGDSPADPAATAIFRAVCQAFSERAVRTDYSDGDPDKEARFQVLVRTLGPAVLLEMGFLSHPEERAWLGEINVQTHMALAIAAGILQWRRQSADDHHARIQDVRKHQGGRP